MKDDDCKRNSSGRGWYYIPYSSPAPAVGGAVDPASGSYTNPRTGRVVTVSRGGFGGRATGGGS